MVGNKNLKYAAFIYVPYHTTDKKSFNAKLKIGKNQDSPVAPSGPFFFDFLIFPTLH